ncbi:MAG: hypothetical protein J3R72DRAFT_256370 [Linnemannia gamsii]|nr:MAG: hypothetical protein J3R72DRAFT_256370 [Linnemannia gamsii]
MANQRPKQQQRHHQHQQQQSGAGSKAPLLVLGAAVLMIQGLLVFPTVNAETPVTIHNPITVNGASIAKTNGEGKVSFDLGVHHNLQTLASLSTGGSGPAGAGPQLWAGSSSSSSPFSDENATTSARQQVKKKQEQEKTTATTVLKDVSSALYRKIRLEEEESNVDAAAAAPSSLAASTHITMTTSSMSTMKKQAREALDDVLSGEEEPADDGDELEQQVASTEREAVSRNTPGVASLSEPDTAAVVAADAKSDIQKVTSKDVSVEAVKEDESHPPYSPSDSDDNKKKRTKKVSVAVVDESKKETANDDNDDADDNTEGDQTDQLQDDMSKKTMDEIVTETDTEVGDASGGAGADIVEDVSDAAVEDEDETPRVGDQVVLDENGNLVKDVTLVKKKQQAVKESVEAKGDRATPSVDKGTKTTLETIIPSDSTEKGDEPLVEAPKPEEVEDEEEEEEEAQPQQEVEEAGDKKKKDAADPETTAPADDKKETPGKKAEDEEDDDDEDKSNYDEETKMEEKNDVDDATAVVTDGKTKKTSHRGQVFAKLREQLLKKQEQEQEQQQQQEQLSQQTSPEDAEAPAEGDLTASTTLTPKIDDGGDGTTTLVRAPDFVPQEDMHAIMNAKAVKDKKEKPLVGAPLTPQQIADTEHQGANAFFELFAADVFPDVKLLGNNQLQDLDFEQRLSKLKEDKKSKAKATAASAGKMDKKDKKKSKKQQDEEHHHHHHQNEKRAAIIPVLETLTEKERIHEALENIFGKDGAAKVEAEAGDNNTSDYKITVQGLNKDNGNDATPAAAEAAAAGDDGEDDDIIEDLDNDEPIEILGAGKNGHNKKHHHKQYAGTIEGDTTTVFSTGDDANKNAKDAKDSKNDKSSSSSTTGSLPDAMKPNAGGGPPDRTAPGSSAGQPQQRQQPASGHAAPASPPPPPPASGAKGSTPAAAAPAGTGGGKDAAAGTAGFGTVPMFGPAQLDFGNGAASTLLSSSSLVSKGSMAFALAFGIAWMAL